MRKILKSSFWVSFVFLIQTNNHPPVVQILLPVNASAYTWNSILPYSVKIKDAEDGESQFEEINTSEVLVVLKLTGDRAKAAAYEHQKKFPDTAGLMNMVTSNCFNCHAVRSKLSGPSFQEISRKYKAITQHRDSIVHHIVSGSTGIWGKEVMPTHPELSKKQVSEMVAWIFQFADDPTLNVYTGFRGSLTLARPAGYKEKGAAVISAYYRDHGSSEPGSTRLAGSDHLVVQLTGY